MRQTVTCLIRDALGSIRGAVGSTGAIGGTASYDAWGNPRTPGGLTSIMPFGFAGGIIAPSGLIGPFASARFARGRDRMAPRRCVSRLAWRRISWRAIPRSRCGPVRSAGNGCA